MSHSRLTADQVKTTLPKLPNWQFSGGKLMAEYKFANFRQAFGFMTQVAMMAEKLNHHPDWSNSYSTVTFELWTHETGGVTEHDVELAEAIVKIAKQTA